MDRNKFIQTSAQIRVLEKKLLNRQYMQRLIEANGLEETLRYLSDSTYQPFINKLERAENYELALRDEIQRFFEEVYSISPSKLPVDLVSLKYIYHNLKVLLKEIVQDEDYTELYMKIGEFNLPRLREDLDQDNNKSNEELFVVAREALDLYNESKDPQDIDIYVDNKYFEKLIELSKLSEIELFDKYVKDLIDWTNIKTLLRCQRQEKSAEFLDKVLIDGGNINKKDYSEYIYTKLDPNSQLFKPTRIYKFVKRGIEQYELDNSLSEFEKEMDNYFISMIKEVHRVTYGPEVVFAYTLAKEIEIKNLRIILIAELNGLSSEFVRERLRETYV